MKTLQEKKNMNLVNNCNNFEIKLQSFIKKKIKNNAFNQFQKYYFNGDFIKKKYILQLINRV